MQFTPTMRTALTAFVATLIVATGIVAATIADRYAAMVAQLDTEVLLLFLPCCALLFAVIVEVIRTIARGQLEIEEPARPLAWNVLAAGR